MPEGKITSFAAQTRAARRGTHPMSGAAGPRLALVRQWASWTARILDDGCGVGMYTARFHEFSPYGGRGDRLAAADQADTHKGSHHR
jgi:hypothetical protein